MQIIRLWLGFDGNIYPSQNFLGVGALKTSFFLQKLCFLRFPRDLFIVKVYGLMWYIKSTLLPLKFWIGSGWLINNEVVALLFGRK